MALTLIAPFLAALAVSLVLTPICRLVSRRLGLVAKPNADRWHRKPTALFGGVAIAVTTIGVAAANGPLTRELWELAACASCIAAFGFIDDLLTLKASTKLIVQIIVASAFVFFGFRLEWTKSLVTDTMLTLFWLVAITNALNLLDNMDGLCAGVTLVAGGFLVAGLLRQPVVAAATLVYVAAFLGATTGFLVYNVHPASIFMGDTGSLFLGFNLAALTLLVRTETNGRSGLLSVVGVPVLLLLIPILDTTLVTAARLLSGRRPSQGGRDHSSHRLVAVGLSERSAVTTLWGLAVAGGTVALILQDRDPTWSMIVSLTFLLAVVIFAVYLARIRVYDDVDPVLTEGAITPLVANFMYKRRVAEVLLDLCLIPLSYYTAYRLRFEGDLLALSYPMFLQSLPIVLASQLVALFLVGGYRGTWRFFGMMDAVVFAKGVLLGTVAAEVIILYVYRFENYSRSVFIIYGVLLMLLLSATRASFRLIGEFVQRRRSSGHRCVVYGTGGAGVSVIRDAFGELPVKITGFVDDNPVNRNTRVGGYSVIGGFDSLIELISAGEVDSVVLNMPVVDAARLRRLEEVCREGQVELLRLRVDLKPVSAAS